MVGEDVGIMWNKLVFWILVVVCFNVFFVINSRFFGFMVVLVRY